MWRVLTLDAERQKPEARLKSKIMTKQDFSACHCQLRKLTKYKSIKANLRNAHYILKGAVVRENVRKPRKQSSGVAKPLDLIKINRLREALRQLHSGRGASLTALSGQGAENNNKTQQSPREQKWTPASRNEEGIPLERGSALFQL